MMVGTWIERIRTGSLLLASLFAFGLIACASSGGASDDGASRNVITRAEIAQSNLTTAYEVVRQLRPAFLQRRRARSITGETMADPVIYVDGVARGEPSELRLIDALIVQEIRYLDATDATMRFGTGHSAGAILVTTRAG